jgi:4-hydroxy-3-polyprenylbenzoate decarboxylase
MKRMVVAITGASGAMYGIRLLHWLRESRMVEIHLMISDAGVLSLHHELDMKRKDVEALADVVHSVRDVGACVASGSFQSEGMIIAPCWPL